MLVATAAVTSAKFMQVRALQTAANLFSGILTTSPARVPVAQVVVTSFWEGEVAGANPAGMKLVVP
jgi:hypothetical protein